MLLAIVMLLSGIILFVLMPLLALKRYYSPSQYNIAYNLLWFIITVITWPLVPIVIAIKHKDKMLLNMFWLSLLIFTGSFAYWLFLNYEQIIQIAGVQMA